MIGPLGVRFLAGDVEEEVGREGEDLLTDEHEESVDWGVTQVMLRERVTI